MSSLALSHVFIVAFFVLASSIYRIETRPNELTENQTENKEHYSKHTARIKHFRCKHPRANAVAVSELTTIGSDDFFTPQMTVLHRCDSGAGCCQQKGFTCQPRTMEDVELVFRVEHLAQQIEGDFVTVVAKNHTSCSCQEVKGFDMPR